MQALGLGQPARLLPRGEGRLNADRWLFLRSKVEQRWLWQSAFQRRTVQQSFAATAGIHSRHSPAENKS